MDITLIKLTTGEEIVGEVVESTADGVKLKNCLAIMLRPSPEGISYGFMPWGSLTKDDKVISKQHIVYSAQPTDELKNGYSSMFGGIVTTSKQLIT
jgi:hypothetical protein